MAVSPGGVLPCWGTGGIEEAGLREQDEGPLGVAVMAHVVFGRGDFLEAAAEVHGGGSFPLGGLPGNGAVQRVIDFEDPGAVTVARELSGKSCGETVARDAQQLVRGDVAEN